MIPGRTYLKVKVGPRSEICNSGEDINISFVETDNTGGLRYKRDLLRDEMRSEDPLERE